MMALRQMLGVACLAYHLILATTVVGGVSISTSGPIHSVGLPYYNSTVLEHTSSKALSASSAIDTPFVDAAPTATVSPSGPRKLSGTDAVPSDHTRISSAGSASLSSSRISGTQATQYESRSGSGGGLSAPSAGVSTKYSHVPSMTDSSSFRSESIQYSEDSKPTSVSGSDPAITPPTGSSEYYALGSSITNSGSVRATSSQPHFTQGSESSGSVNVTTNRHVASGQDNHSEALVPSSSPSSTQSSPDLLPPKPNTAQVGTIGRPSEGNESGMNGSYVPTGSRLPPNSYPIWSERTYPTAIRSSGTAEKSQKQYLPGEALSTGVLGSMRNATKNMYHNAATISTTPVGTASRLTFTTSTSMTTDIANPTYPSFSMVNLTSGRSVFTSSSHDNPTPTAAVTTNLTSSESTFNSTGSPNPRPNLWLPQYIPQENLTTLTASVANNQSLMSSYWGNMTLDNKNILYVNESRQPHFKVGIPASPDSREPWLGLAVNQTGQCSGTRTVYPGTATIIYTAVIEIYEELTLYGNATTPPPSFIIPPEACTTSSPALQNSKPPGGDTSVSSLLLVTKKVPVVVRSPQPVGPIFNIPTTTAEPKPAQSTPTPNLAQDSPAQRMQEPGGADLSAGSAPLQQAFALADSVSPSGSPPSEASKANPGYSGEKPVSYAGGSGSKPGQGTGSNPPGSISNSVGSGPPFAGSDSNVPGSSSNAVGSGSNPVGSGSNVAGSGSNAGSSGSSGAMSGSNAAGSVVGTADSGSAGSPGNTVHPPIGGQAPGKDRQTKSNGQSSESGSQTASEGQATGNDDHATSGAQTSNGNGQSIQTVSGEPEPEGEGQTPGGQTTSENGDQSSSNSGQSTSSSNGSESDDTVSGQSSSGKGATGPQNMALKGHGPAGSGGQYSTGQSGAVGSDSGQATDEDLGGAGSETDQYVPKAVTVDNVPVSVDEAAVIVGSQTISAGSPPTTVIADGQTIQIDQSQIIASGTTVPIEVAHASQPASSITIGSVPVVLQPSNVVIGSQTFSHGTSAAFAVYNNETYSWDAKQLVGPGGTMAAFPSATIVPPRITAGGQVFSVFSSTLKASGTNIAIPNTPAPSPFVYQNQTFSVDSSQLVVPDTSITVPSATTKPTPFVYKGQTFSIDNSQFIAPSATLPLSSGSGTVRYGTTVLTVDRTQVICPDSTTIALSSMPQAGDHATPSAVTTGGLTFSLGPAAAVVASSTYSFLPGQAPATVTDQGRTVTIAPSGIEIGSIHVPVPTFPPTYSLVSQGNLTFSVAPSAVVFNSQTISVPPGVAPTTTTVNGQEISIGSQGVGLGGTKVPLPKATDPSGFAVVTQDGITFSVAPSAVVLGGQTNSIQSGMAPITTNINGRTVSIGPQGVGFSSTTIPLPMPTNSAGYAVVRHGDLTFSVATSAVVLDGQTNSIGSGMSPITTTANGQTVTIGPKGVEIGSNTIPLPTPPPAYAIVTRGDLTFSIASSKAVVKGSTFAIGPNMTATMVFGGQTIGVGPSEVKFPGTTVNLPSATSNYGPASVTAGGLTFGVGPTDAVFGGTTYAIGSGAVAKTIVVGSETIGLGTNGVVLPSTTVPPEQTPTAVTADGLTFSADATEAIINGTAYAIGSEAVAKTIVYGSKTIGLGTKGIVLSSTTIVPWGNATQTSLYSVYSASGAAASSSVSSVSAAAAMADTSPTDSPGQASGGTMIGMHSGTEHAPWPPRLLIVVVTSWGLMLGLLACLP